MDRGDDAEAHRAALAEFARAMSGEPDGVQLDDAALALSAVLQPGLDVVGWMAALDHLAASCPTPTRAGVVGHLIGAEGFRGDDRTYADWRNSCLDQVIARRRGIPITLSVVVIEVARRLGVSLCGVGMPVHFLVGDPADPDWFAYPFGGELLDRAGCRELLDRRSGGSVPWDDAYLLPVPNRAVIARMLNNLRAGAIRPAHPVRLALVMQMRQLLPEFASERADAVRALSVFN